MPTRRGARVASRNRRHGTGAELSPDGAYSTKRRNGAGSKARLTRLSAAGACYETERVHRQYEVGGQAREPSRGAHDEQVHTIATVCLVLMARRDPQREGGAQHLSDWRSGVGLLQRRKANRE